LTVCGTSTWLLEMQAATASAAQCMTSFLWGSISDHTGRKVQSKQHAALFLLRTSHVKVLNHFVARAACADGWQYLSLSVNPGTWPCTQLQCGHPLTVHRRPVYLQHWRVSFRLMHSYACSVLLHLSCSRFVCASHVS